MTKFFDKKLEVELGTGAAVQVAALANDLRTFMDTANAIRIAQGKPTLEQEMAEYDAWVEEEIRSGRAKPEDFEWEPPLAAMAWRTVRTSCPSRP
ncbi:hypothetical protein [Cupriavidus necator]|uniref:hypothetical protein n=1 Tax=Cupriavidus necator TaxID=106590 RepID=UPI0012D2E466|nr:hypothetical protein [Cupriavidus necator]